MLEYAKIMSLSKVITKMAYILAKHTLQNGGAKFAEQQ